MRLAQRAPDRRSCLQSLQLVRCSITGDKKKNGSTKIAIASLHGDCEPICMPRPSLSKELDLIAAAIARVEERLRSLEDDRLRVKAWAALIVFAGSVGAFLLGKFWPT